MNPWLVVPTLGNRDHSLIPLLRDAGMPSVVVNTGSMMATPGADQTILIPSLVNIQTWWNRGIDRAVGHGADVVVVVNDDVQAAPGALLELAACLESDVGLVGGHTPMLAWPNDPEHAKGRVTGITGWCFALDPVRIRPDESFAWWWGDNDLQLRAQAMNPFGGCVTLKGLNIRHLRTDFSYDRDVSDLIEADRVTFTRRYPALMGGWK